MAAGSAGDAGLGSGAAKKLADAGAASGSAVKFAEGAEAAATKGEGTSETELVKLDWALAAEAATKTPRSSAEMAFIGISPKMCGLRMKYYGYYPTVNEGAAKCLWAMMKDGARKAPCSGGQFWGDGWEF